MENSPKLVCPGVEQTHWSGCGSRVNGCRSRMVVYKDILLVVHTIFGGENVATMQYIIVLPVLYHKFWCGFSTTIYC